MTSLDLNLGSFWPKTSVGFLKNDTSSEKIDTFYLPAIEKVVDWCKREIGTNLLNLYLFGSVPRGLAQIGVSDVDFLIITDDIKIAKDKTMFSDFKTNFYRGDIVTDINIEFATRDQTMDDKYFSEPAFITSVQSVCLYGNPAIAPIFRPGIEIANHDIVRIATRIKIAREDFIKNRSQMNLHYWTPRLMKKIIRVGFLLTDRANEDYTKDLSLCYKVFCETFPDKKNDMNTALELVFVSNHQIDEVLEILDRLGNWVIEKSDLWLSKYNPTRMAELGISYQGGEILSFFA